MAEALRILGIADVGYVHTHKWANWLAARGHALRLVSFCAFDTKSTQSLRPTIDVAGQPLPPFHLKRFWLTLGALLRLRRLFHSFRPDIVHAHFLGTGAWYAALSGARPLVLSVMGGDITNDSWSPLSLRERILTPLALRRADAAVCWSTKLIKIVKPMLRQSAASAVIVGGVDLSQFRRSDVAERRRARDLLRIGMDDFVVLSPRLYRPWQNIELIIQAFSQVRSARRDAILVLIKHRAWQFPEYETRMERLIDALNVRSSVRTLPTVRYDEMPQLISAADCVVSTGDHDGTPMSLMEAMACGTPCIVHDLPDYDSRIFSHEQTVLRVPCHETETLARAILSVATDQSLRDRLTLRGRDAVHEHADYEVEMRRLEQLYHAVVGNRT